jgi:hypothetical protein
MCFCLFFDDSHSIQFVLLTEYANNLGSAVSEEQTRQEKERILKLANAL